jgi:hypothetical protein
MNASSDAHSRFSACNGAACLSLCSPGGMRADLWKSRRAKKHTDRNKSGSR